MQVYKIQHITMLVYLHNIFISIPSVSQDMQAEMYIVCYINTNYG